MSLQVHSRYWPLEKFETVCAGLSSTTGLRVVHLNCLNAVLVVVVNYVEGHLMGVAVGQIQVVAETRC